LFLFAAKYFQDTNWEQRYNKNKHNKRKNGKHLKTFSVYVICCKK